MNAISGLDTNAVIQAAAVVISALLGIIGVMLGIVLRSQIVAKKSATATLHQVKNSHDTNLRDDLDEKQDEVRDLITQVRNDVGDVRIDLREVRQAAHDDRTQNRTSWRNLADQVADLRTDLENTKPPARKRAIKPKETP